MPPSNQAKRTPVNQIKIQGRIPMMVNPPKPDQTTVFNTSRMVSASSSASTSPQAFAWSPSTSSNVRPAARGSGSGGLGYGGNSNVGSPVIREDKKDLFCLGVDKITGFVEEMMGQEVRDLVIVGEETELNFVELNERIAEECQVPYPSGLSYLVVVKTEQLDDLLAANEHLISENRRMKELLRSKERH